ncbi:hypothetical protein BDF21DRAFT_408017 [Thamnidium elegans]|nr:hypothetical protein BDF21DRAFT_408017 [Thamnidium elegans]
MFSFIRFNNNPQLQYAFARILEEEADDFNLELGIDTSCFLVPELFSQLLRPVIAQRPLCYKSFKIGTLQQVCSENYIARITRDRSGERYPRYKAKITDTNTIECSSDTGFPLLNKGEIINNVPSNRIFYLENKKISRSTYFGIYLYRLKTMNYLEKNNFFKLVDTTFVDIPSVFERGDVYVPVMVSISYISYSSSLQFFIKVVGAGNRDEGFTDVIETGEPLTLTRF